MRWLDLTVIVAYLAAITWFGARFRSSQRSLRDYFLGGRSAPWWAIALSIVSAETSTLTVIGTPALSFTGNFGFLQVVLGYLLARIVISTLLLPHYFRGEIYTAYELMERRFGTKLRRLTAVTFLALRALAEGVRVFAISIVVAIVLQTSGVSSILLIVVLTLFYTFEGGMTAVIWTDVIQMFLYVGGAILSFFVILGKIPGGWEHVSTIATESAKFQVFDFRFAFTQEFFARTYNFWAGLIGGCFLTTASHGTEQLLVQRLLAARSQAESRLALLSSWIVVAFQFSLFLLIGVVLYVYYRDAGLQTPPQTDRIYPQFVWNELPTGLAGLITAAILAAAMSNLSAALNSLASTTVMDLWKPLGRPRSDADWLKFARYVTIAWAAILFVIGVLSQGVSSVLEAGLRIASVVYGALLGVFLLGVLTKRVGQNAAIFGMATGLSVMIYAYFATRLSFTWYVALGSTVTFLAGCGASLFIKEPARDAA